VQWDVFLGRFVPWDVFWDVLCRGTFSSWDVLRVGHFESGTFREWDVLRVGRLKLWDV
jgi:hypothetical protein